MQFICVVFVYTIYLSANDGDAGKRKDNRMSFQQWLYPDIGPILELKCERERGDGGGELPLSTIKGSFKRRSHTGVVKSRVPSLDGYTC